MMRNFFIILIAFVVMLVSCSKEDVNSTADYQVLVNAQIPQFGSDTRAPRSEWVDGDQIIVVFSGDLESQRLSAAYLLLTYNQEQHSWSQNWLGTSANEVANKQDKSLAAIYGSSGFNGASFYRGDRLSVTPRAVLDRSSECVMKCDQSEGSYTVSGNVITLNIPMTPLVSQFTIRGISLDDSDWKLKCDQLYDINAGGISLQDDALKAYISIIVKPQSRGMLAYPNADGVAFFGQPKSSDPTNYTFTLTNGTDTYTRTFTDKSINIGNAIIMNGPVDGDLNGWIEQ